MSGKTLRRKVAELLEKTSLASRAKNRVLTFSDGMKRRLNIAASLVHSPKLLYCDEATVGVDPQSRSAIFSLLESLNKEGMTVVYTTHYMEEAERLCKRTAIIDHGRVLAEGILPELLSLLPDGRSLRWKHPPAPISNDFLSTASGFGTVITDPDGHRRNYARRNPSTPGNSSRWRKKRA